MCTIVSRVGPKTPASVGQSDFKCLINLPGPVQSQKTLTTNKVVDGSLRACAKVAQRRELRVRD
jgi:hypothetical protein